MRWRKSRGDVVAHSSGYRCVVWLFNGKYSCEVTDRHLIVAHRHGLNSATTAQNYAERALTKYLRAELKRIRAELDGAS